jgi:hypothetical protein
MATTPLPNWTDAPAASSARRPQGLRDLTPQFAGCQRGVEADEAAVADLQPPGLDAEAGLEDRDHLAQLLQPPGGVFTPDFRGGLAEERHGKRCDLPAHHGQDQHALLQIATRKLTSPGVVDVGGKA